MAMSTDPTFSPMYGGFAALRAAKAVLRGQKGGVIAHSLAAPQTKVKEVLPTNSAIADAMVRGFLREKDGDVPISRA